MKQNINIEAEGNELILKNKAGDYVIVPKKYRLEVQDMIKENCHGCIDKLVETLPIMEDYAPDGSVIPSWMNPKNWGVTDYTDKGDFSTAYSSASQAGEKEFMWNDKRYSVTRKNENPYKTDSFESSFIPTTYINNKIGIQKSGIVDTKRDIDLSNGRLYFARTNEATDGNIILGGDYIEDTPTSYPAYDFKNYITERYGAKGNKEKIDNNTQLYYGIVNNKLKTGKITSFNDDDIVVPIRYGGKYDKTKSLSEEEKNLIEAYNQIQNELAKVDFSENTINEWINTQENRPFFDSSSRKYRDYKNYHKEKIINRLIPNESFNDIENKYQNIKNKNATFTRDGVPIYNSGVGGKIILHSPSSGKQLFLFKNSLKEVKEKSQKFLEENPDAEFISMDTGRYNFLIENEEGLEPNDFKTYQEADLKRGDKIGYNIIYKDMLYDYGDGEKKKMYYSDKELSELDVNKKNFDTLALQRELSNRGYKLPKSTKKDGSFDGILGDETKNALLEYRKSQNKLGQ